MGWLIRIIFAIVIGLIVYGLLQWLASAVPHGLDVLFGIVAAIVAYWQAPDVFGGGPGRPLVR